MKTTQITIVEKISTSQFILNCACCNGTGKMSTYHNNSSPYEPCTICNGKGLVLIEIDGQVPFVVCKLCNGSGEQSKYSNNSSPYIICTKCKGVGAQPIAGSMDIIK